MTDWEMTKLCKEAIEFDDRYLPYAGTAPLYDPLHDDAQAMALVKRFHLAIQPPQFVNPPRWHVWVDDAGIGYRKHTGVAGVLNLNRAIVECVAKLGKGRGK